MRSLARQVRVAGLGDKGEGVRGGRTRGQEAVARGGAGVCSSARQVRVAGAAWQGQAAGARGQSGSVHDRYDHGRGDRGTN